MAITAHGEAQPEGAQEVVSRSLQGEIAEVQGTDGVLLTFDDFVQGVEDFGSKIQPLMKSRINVDTPVASQAMSEA